jgi:hypothetical protein
LHCSAGDKTFRRLLRYILVFDVVVQAAAASLRSSGSIAPDVQLRTARVALFNSSNGSPIVCTDPSHVEEMSSDALVTAAGAGGAAAGPLLLTAVRIEARNGLREEEVRVVLQSVCDALQGQMVQGDGHRDDAKSLSPSQPSPVSPPRVAASHSNERVFATTTPPTPPSNATARSLPSPPPPHLSHPQSAEIPSATETYSVPPRSGAKIVGPKVRVSHVNDVDAVVVEICLR